MAESVENGYVIHLPQGVERDARGGYFRRVKVPLGNNEYDEAIRAVCIESLEKARELRQDFFHPQLGWLRDGLKKETDPDPRITLADGSTTYPNPAIATPLA